MGFPPQNPTAPAAPPNSKRAIVQKTLAQVSAMGTTGGAPPGGTPGVPSASGTPGGTPDPSLSAEARQAMPPPNFVVSPTGDGPVRPVVASHAAQRSIGTHSSRSPNKRVNVAHGMTKF